MSYIECAKNSSGEAVNLFYEDWGKGKPVVFIHGWPLNHEMWEYQLTELPKHGFRCIAYDRRGFGKSDKPWDGYNYDTLAADLKSLLDELDLNEVTLVGFSMGGGEVVRYLSRYGSERVSKIVLVSSVVPYLLKTADNPDGVDKETFDGLIEKINDDRPDFLSTFGKQFYGVNFIKKPVSQSLLNWTQMLALQGSPKATLDCVRSFSETNFYADLSAITVPTLIIHGDSDNIVPIKPTSDKTASLIPHAKYIVYEDAPHGLFYTSKEQLNADLMEFISQKTETTMVL